MALFAWLETAATVVGVGAVVLIFMIIQTAATAKENLAMCEQLARRVYLSFKTVNTIIDSFLNLFPTTNVPGPNRGMVQPRRAVSPEGAEKFTLEEISSATNKFAVVLGQGDSGKVYKGKLPDGREVAVKRLEDGLRRAEDTFGMELALLRPLSHDHIVRLVGSCAEGGERMLVYEHMDNGTLRDHLNNASSSSPSWITRVQVLLGAARAIKHLHRHAGVIHSNVTSSNILLDRSLTPRVCGFGAAVRRTPGVLSQAVDVVHTTFGYADPEYYSTGRLKPATDVYSFGVVMLEVLTGKLPVVPINTMLVSIQAGKLGDVLDRRPASEPSPRQREALQLVADTAAGCLCIHGDDRLPISNVVTNLEEALKLVCNDDLFH